MNKLNRSQRLTDVLVEKIKNQSGVISFADYMETVLYHPEYGYYQAPNPPMGKEGDFITAPELSPLFADCLAKAVGMALSQMNAVDVIEYGAGSGQLAIDLMNAFKAQNILINRYIIIEVSQTLREKQKNQIIEALGQENENIIWCDEMPPDFTGVIIANEVLDALPCHTFGIEDDVFYERGVTFNNNRFHFIKQPIFSPLLLDELTILKKTINFPSHYESEINLSSQSFLQHMAKNFKKGVIFIIDYGYTQSEYYHPRRLNGTLTCFYQHHTHDDPMTMPGLCDITAHVDFTRVADTALALDLTVAGFTTQASFLLSLDLMGFVEKREALLSEVEKFELHQAVKRLTFPMEMGDTIKVMALSKGTVLTPLGFSLKDKRYEL